MIDRVTTAEGARQSIVEAIEYVAPDVDAGAIDRSVDVRAAAELDSIDFISVLTRIRDRTGVEVPEADYDRCHTIDGMIEYLLERAGGSSPATEAG